MLLHLCVLTCLRIMLLILHIVTESTPVQPIYHQKKDRTQAHILVCFLALTMWRTLQQWMDGCGLGTAPRKLIEEMAEVHSLDVVLPTDADQKSIWPACFKSWSFHYPTNQNQSKCSAENFLIMAYLLGNTPLTPHNCGRWVSTAPRRACQKKESRPCFVQVVIW